MSLRFRLTLSLAATLFGAASALAADYDPPIFIETAPEYVPVEIGTGWYLRGDLTYSMKTKPSGPFEYRTYNPFTATYGSAEFDRVRLRDDFDVGGGFGYHFTDWLRADVTLDAGRIRFDGATSADSPCLPWLEDTTCRSESRATGMAYSALVNAYADLGTFSGFTPYVGGGLGYTYLRFRGLDSDIYCVQAGGTCGFPAYTASVNHSRAESWRFTYAVMAGVAFDASDNMKVDLGYRYRRIAGGDMFGWDEFSREAGARGMQGRDNGFSQHQIRLGVRYALW